MNRKRKIHQQSILDSTGLLPRKNWKAGLLHIVLLLLVVFVTEISGVRADMVFDFQMKLAQKGNAEAQFKVGEMYEAGRGVEKNMEVAMKWINKAAAHGNKAASYKLLYYDLKKNSIDKVNKSRLDQLQKAATAGDGNAQYYLGLMYSRGVGLNRNNTLALDWLGKASLLGITAAETEIMRVNEAKRNARPGVNKKEAKTKSENQQAQKDKEKRAQQRQAERTAAGNDFNNLRLAAKKQADAEKQRQAEMQQHKRKEQE